MTLYDYNSKVRTFVDDLAMYSPVSMDELRQRVSKFMQVEEIRKYMNKIRAENIPIEKQRS